jgi:ABC-type sugar transport system substrate-binding protein
VVNLAERQVREFARACVRAGLMSPEELHAEVVAAITADLPDHGGDAHALAGAWLQEAREELRRDESGWPQPTDYDRLQTAFAELDDADVVVLQGCEDHWAAKAVLDARADEGARPRGIAWFTPPDVWHAVDEGMLEVNLWHGSTANAAPGDELLDEVLGTLQRHGLDAHFDEGRIEVAAHWHRRDVP